MDFFVDITVDAFWDTLRIVPFLFLCYWAMEAIEHAAGKKTEEWVQKAGAFGPLIGALLGSFPQCGFSAGAATLYSGRVITLGTLFAVFLATSDEMLPILIAEQASPVLMAQILVSKVIIGMVMGFAIDLFLRLTHRVGKLHMHIHEMCEDNNCDCERGVLKSALYHTVQVTLFVFLFSLVINGIVEGVGKDVLASFLATNPLLSIVASATVGLIPNCAASILITELYLDGALSTGAMMAGLLSAAGVGLLVLFRANKPISRSLLIMLGLWLIAIFWGIIFQIAGIVF